MAGKIPLISSKRKRSVSRILDAQGNVFLEIGSEQVTIFHPDGTIEVLSESDSISLVSGGVFHPTMSMGKDPVMLLDVCEFCRSPEFSVWRSETPTHGLCDREAGELCAGCQAFMCRNHAQKCADDEWRCRRCAGRYRARRTIGSICNFLFFTSKEN